jgi:hypothetical protein
MKMFMKKFVIKAFSQDEAKQKALELGLNVVKNVTNSWKNADSPAIESDDFKTFANEIFEKNRLSSTTGVGLMVVETPGVQDDRSRPYEFVNNVAKGSIEKKRIFEIRLAADDKLISEAETKGDAMRKAKELMSEYRQDIVTKVVYRVLGEKGTAFKLKYTPSIKTTEGTYVVFGNINDSF